MGTHRIRPAHLGLGLTALASAAVLALPLTAGPSQPEPATPAAAYVAEDEPGFDCATMGNRHCGCPAEDMLAVTLAAPAYDMAEGTALCVHLDATHPSDGR